MRTLILKIETKFREPDTAWPDGIWESTISDDDEKLYVMAAADTAREAIADALRLAAKSIESGHGPIGGGGTGGKKLKHEPEKTPDPTLQVRS